MYALLINNKTKRKLYKYLITKCRRRLTICKSIRTTLPDFNESSYLFITHLYTLSDKIRQRVDAFHFNLM